jgi:predicted transcriptional regulator
MTSIGVNFTAKTRAELELLAAGRNRTINWCIRNAVEAQLAVNKAELQEYAIRYPELAAKIPELAAKITELTEGKESAI